MAETAFKMSEKELQKAVVDAARRHGWRLAHFRASQSPKGNWLTAQTGDPGFPDLILVRKGRMLAVELKSDKGKLGPGQQQWLTMITMVEGADAYVWRPKHWHSGVIEEVLGERE